MRMVKTLGVIAATVLGAMRVFAEPTLLDGHEANYNFFRVSVEMP